MAYATLADVRAEGITEAQASNQRVEDLLDEVTTEIDKYTGWFFEPRALTIRIDGRGTPSVEPPYVPIELTSLSVDGDEIEIIDEELLIKGGPVLPGFYAPRITRVTPTLGTVYWSSTRGRKFAEGQGNMTIVGTWGYTVPDPLGDPLGRTPPAIKRATIMMLQRLVPLVGDTQGTDEARNSWRLLEERTRDQSYKLSDKSGAGFGADGAPLTGDPAIDEILLRFMKPHGLGAVRSSEPVPGVTFI